MISYGIFVLTAVAVHVFGLVVGYKLGMYKGIEISIKISIKETISILRESFRQKGLEPEFDQAVKDSFDLKKLEEDDDETETTT